MEADKNKILQSANLLAARGQFDKALAEWKKLLTDSPNDGTIHNSIGDLHLKRNAPGEAIEAYLQAGAAFRAAGSVLKAIAVYKKILKLDPTHYKAYHNLGQLNAERGLINNAVSDYLTLSKLYLEEGAIREALAVYRTVVNLDPANLDARRRLAELCFQENLRDEAIRTYLQLGRECVVQQQIEKAREAYEAVLKIDPSNDKAQRFLKDPLASLQDTEPSMHSGLSAISTESDRHPSLEQAVRQIHAGQYSEAESLLSELLSSQPGDPEVCRLLAMLHLNRGELAVALSEIQFLAEAAMRAEDYALAASMIQEYLTVDPRCVPLLELLGSMFEHKGDEEAAAVQYGKAIKALLEEPDPEMPTRAAELYEKIRTIAPASPVVDQLASVFSPAVTTLPPPTVSDSEPPQTELESLKKLADPLDIPAVETTQEVPVPAAAELEPRKQPSEEIYKIHYELGVAYKNMGMLNEAIEEFRVAMDGHDAFLDASSMLSACLKEQGAIKSAIECLEQALSDPRGGGDKSISIRYELGALYEAEGLLDKAVEVFSTIPAFLDVSIRLDRLKGVDKPQPSGTGTTRLTPTPSASGEPTPMTAAGASSRERKKRRISYL